MLLIVAAMVCWFGLCALTVAICVAAKRGDAATPAPPPAVRVAAQTRRPRPARAGARLTRSA
jgi:hypothetical protein